MKIEPWRQHISIKSGESFLQLNSAQQDFYDLVLDSILICNFSVNME